MCETPMTHLGYFSWACEGCGHRCEGELPVGRPRPAEEKKAG